MARECLSGIDVWIACIHAARWRWGSACSWWRWGVISGLTGRWVLLLWRGVSIVLLLSRWWLGIGRAGTVRVVLGVERSTISRVWLLANWGIINRSSELLWIRVRALRSVASLGLRWRILIWRRRTCLERYGHVVGRYAGS